MKRLIYSSLWIVLSGVLLKVTPVYADPVGVPGPNPCGDIGEDQRLVASLMENDAAYKQLGDDAAACAPTLHGDNARCDMFSIAADAYAAGGALSTAGDRPGYRSAQTLIYWALASQNYTFASVSCVGVNKDKADHADSGHTSAMDHLLGRS